MTSDSGIHSEIKVGDPLVVGNRTIYPLARVSAFGFWDWAFGGGLSPLALLILEHKNVYVIPLFESLTLEEILRLEPSLKSKVNRAMGTYRISIT